MSRKGRSELWLTQLSLKADEGGVLDLFIMCSCVYELERVCCSACVEDRRQLVRGSLGHVDPRVQTEVVRLGCRDLYPPASPGYILTATSDSQRRKNRKYEQGRCWELSAV